MLCCTGTVNFAIIWSLGLISVTTITPVRDAVVPVHIPLGCVAEIILSVCFYILTWTVAKVGKHRVFWGKLNVPNISISNMKSAQHKENVKQVSVMWERLGYVYIWVYFYLWSVSMNEYSSLWCCADSTGYFQSNISNIWNAGQHCKTLSLEAIIFYSCYLT